MSENVRLSIAEEVHRWEGAMLCVDGVAYAPHREVDVKDLDADFYSFSLYKTYGPHIAALYASSHAQSSLTSLGHYFHNPDTLNMKLGLAAASYELVSSIPWILSYFGPSSASRRATWTAIAAHEEHLRSILLEYLNKRDDVTVYGVKDGNKELRVPVVSFSVKARGSKEIVEKVDGMSEMGIRWGHFYSKRLVDDVLGQKGEGVVRVSMVHYNTDFNLEDSLHPFKRLTSMASPSDTAGKCIAWQRHNFTARIDERLSAFESRSFNITVGAGQRIFTAHEAFLCQSPVFERMIHVPFKESASRHIILPEDDPAVIAIIIQYLYAGNFWPSEHALATECSEELSQDASAEFDKIASSIRVLGEVYLMAEKYQLPDLQRQTVGKLSQLVDVKTRPIEFLNNAKRVYTGIPDTDTIYRQFYQTRIAAMVDGCERQMDSKLAAPFDECTSEGGILALDSLNGLRKSYDEEARKVQMRLQAAEKISSGRGNRVAALEARLAELEIWPEFSGEHHTGERNSRAGGRYIPLHLRNS
ncbi:MAG: hypothetical protein Q9183_004759 [Haloplaca sp. 2 TL-2023]